MENLRNRAYYLLRQSEGFFKADMVYLAKGNFWQVSGQVATSILSLGLVVLFANILPKETYGLYKYILSLAGVLNIFALGGMNRAVVQAVAAGNEGAFRTSVKYQLKWNLIQLCAFWILSGYYFFNDNYSLAISFLVMSFFSPVTAALNTYGGYLEGKKSFGLNNFFSTLSTLIYVVSMALIIFMSGEIVWLVVAYSLATFTSTLIFYRVTLRLFKPPVSEARDVLKYGREMTYIGAIGTIVSQLDKIILSHYWGATQLAVYALATAIPERATTFIKSWVGIGLPKFSEKTPAEINKVFYIRILQGMALGCLCFAAYFALAPSLFKYLLPKYLEGVFYSQLLAISFIFAIPNRYITLLMTSQKLSGSIFLNNSIQNVIKVTLYIIFGISGGILGLIGVNVFMSFLATIVSAIIWKIKSSE